MSNKLDELIENEVSVDLEKRKFMNKFGKYAAVSVGMATLMTANASGSFNSGCKTKKSCGGSDRPQKSSGGGSNREPKWGNRGQGRSGNNNGNPIKIRRRHRDDD